MILLQIRYIFKFYHFEHVDILKTHELRKSTLRETRTPFLAKYRQKFNFFFLLENDSIYVFESSSEISGSGDI